MSTSPEPGKQEGEVPPHTPLTDYYAAEPDREEYVADLFNRNAQYYNTIEKVFFNGGLWYRRFSLGRAGLSRGMKVLDVAVGTAAVARGAVKLVGPEGRVFGVDPSPGMLGEARKVFHGPLTRGFAEHLPFAGGHFDFVTMGIALRHVSDLVGTFREYQRVLKPGGTLWILEGHVPDSRVGHWLTRQLWKRVIPGLSYVFTGSNDAKEFMDYYWDTVEKCVPPPEILEAMTKAGFDTPEYKVVVPGSFSEYTARKPSL